MVTLTVTSSGTSRTRAYFLKDHLGSTHLIVSDTGVILQGMAFDAWGKRRSDDDYSGLSVSALTAFDTDRTRRGFTGHEGLDPVGLIHMNGRVYEPKIGRFISADPFIEAPDSTQSYNRYSYVWNNPTSFTDPSGYGIAAHYLTRQVDKAIRSNPMLGAVIQVGVTAVAVWACGPCAIGVSGLVAARMTYGQTGDYGSALRSGVIAAATSAAFYGAGGIQNDFGRFATEGVIGGLSSVAGGGKFGPGFASAGLSFAAGAGGLLGAHGGGVTSRGLITSFVIGGTVSEITGGSFANGAVTASFRYLLNDALEHGGGDSNKESEMERQFRTGEMSHEGRLALGSLGVDIAGVAECGSVSHCIAELSGIEEQVRPYRRDNLDDQSLPVDDPLAKGPKGIRAGRSLLLEGAKEYLVEGKIKLTRWNTGNLQRTEYRVYGGISSRQELPDN